MRRAGGERAGLLIRAPAEDHFSGDVDYPYRPDNNLYYLTGVDAPGCALLLSLEEMKDMGREALFLATSSPHSKVWVGEEITRERASERSGVPLRAIGDLESLRDLITKLEPRSFHHFPGGRKSPRTLFFDTGRGFEPGKSPTEPYGFLLETLGGAAFHLDLRSSGEILHPMRQVKSSAEVAHLEKAVQATARAQVRAWRALRPGIREYEIRAVIEETFIREGCPGWSFPPIVGTGPNTCVLHYERYDRETRDGDLVLMDIGAEFPCYSADVTRTVPVNGRFTPRQREIYSAVLAAQEAAIREIRPGVRFARVHETAFREGGAALKRLGLIQNESETGKYFLHGTSHGLGLDVHDPMPADTLAPGMVITVEPGIYIPEESLGVRIEDDVLVTEDGSRVLSGSLPRQIEEIEAIMAAREF